MLQLMKDPINSSQAQSMLRQAQKHLKEVLLKAQHLRDIHLEERAEVSHQLGNGTKTQAILAIKERKIFEVCIGKFAASHQEANPNNSPILLFLITTKTRS